MGDDVDKPSLSEYTVRTLGLSHRVCREMSQDLLDGMTDKEVAEKEYHYVLEVFYYTKKEYVPKNDLHWETIRLIKFDPETGTFKCDIEI